MLNEQDLEGVAGGKKLTAAVGIGEWMTVTGLQTGVLALRTQPNYDYSNEMKGSELYNGDRVQIKSKPVQGSDGRTYVKVYSPKSGKTGYVNYAFLS